MSGVGLMKGPRLVLYYVTSEPQKSVGRPSAAIHRKIPVELNTNMENQISKALCPKIAKFCKMTRK